MTETCPQHADPPPPNTHEAPRSPRRRGTAHLYPTTDTTRHNPYLCAPCVGKGTQHAQQGHKGEGRWFVLHSPKGGLSTGIWRQEVVMCPLRGKDPASGHPRAHQPLLGRGSSLPAWDGRLDAPGQRRRRLPSSVWTRRREVKQGKSGGSVGTTDQGNGKGRSGERPMGTTAYGGKGQGKGKGSREGRIGQGGRGRSQGDERPMGTTAYGGQGSKGRAANGDRHVGAASCKREQYTMASCQLPPPPQMYASPKFMPPPQISNPLGLMGILPLNHAQENRTRTNPGYSCNTTAKLIHLKKAVIVVCCLTSGTLVEAWATTAEDAAPAPLAPVFHAANTIKTELQEKKNMQHLPKNLDLWLY